MTHTEPHKGYDARADVIQGLVQGDHNNVTLVYKSGKERTVPFLAPPLPLDHSIVGHEALLKEVKSRLMAGRGQALVVLPGVGKTALAIEVANDREILEHFPDGVLWVSLGHRPDYLAELKRWALSLGIEGETLAELRSVRQAQDAISTALKGRRMLIVVDDVWHESDASCFMLGTDCVHLVTSRIPLEVQGFSDQLTKVGELTDEQGLSLLKQFAPKAMEAEPAAARELVHASGGLPLALVLLGKYLRRESRTGDAERIRQAFDSARLQLSQDAPAGAELPAALAAAIELSYSNDGLGDDGRLALRALSIFRPKPHEFSKQMAWEIADVDAEHVWKLDDAGLIEHVRSAEGISYYTMQRTIADFARGRIPDDELKERYQRAVEYFRERMRELEEEGKAKGDYASWYRYEAPEWQMAKDNWLYYLGHYGDQSTAILAFLRAYFDAFWWWGCYLDFAFCDQLVKEWEERETSDLGKQVLKQVQRFQSGYPKETEDRHSGAWPEVEAALRKLLELSGLAGDAAQLPDKESRHIRGLADIFMAEVFRFGRSDPEQAAKWYREAGQLFEADADNWDMAWLLYHFADMNFERGEVDTALEQLQRALELGKLAQDPEVTAQAYRAQGDVFLSLGDIARAGASYRLALFHAYRFQADPEPPDPYTVHFYTQMVDRVFGRMKDLHGKNKSDALAMSSALYAFWEPYRTLQEVPGPTPDFEVLWAQGRTPEIRAHLFPPGLGKADIAARGRQYGEEVNAVCREIAQRVETSGMA